jgi:hypothetical protein
MYSRKRTALTSDRDLDPQVEALGRRIHEQLQRSSDDDLLSAWVATRLAELMTRVEQGTDPSAARECTSLILELWEKRASWPVGWPPEDVDQVLESLRQHSYWGSAPDSQHQVDPGSWIRALHSAVTSIKREQRLWLTAALGELNTKEIANWLTVADSLTGEEESTLRGMIELSEKATGSLLDHLGDSRRASRQGRGPTGSRYVIAQIRKLQQERRTLADNCRDVQIKAEADLE